MRLKSSGLPTPAIEEANVSVPSFQLFHHCLERSTGRPAMDFWNPQEAGGPAPRTHSKKTWLKKLAPKFIEPYVIAEVIDPVAVELAQVSLHPPSVSRFQDQLINYCQAPALGSGYFNLNSPLVYINMCPLQHENQVWDWEKQFPSISSWLWTEDKFLLQPSASPLSCFRKSFFHIPSCVCELASSPN